MNNEKYKLTDINREHLRLIRKQRKLAAEDVSVELGFSKAWLGQIERGKLQTIKYHDLAKLMAIYFPEWSAEKLKTNGVIQNYLDYGLPLETMDEHLSKLDNLDFTNIFYKCIEHSVTYEEREKTFNGIQNLLDCIHDYPGVMSSFLLQVHSLHIILDNYSYLPSDQFYRCVNALITKTTHFLNEEYKHSEQMLNKSNRDDSI